MAFSTAGQPERRQNASVNPLLSAVQVPPIAAAKRWLTAYDGGLGPAVDLSQAVPGHAPSPAFQQRFLQAAALPATATYGDILGDRGLRDAYARETSAAYGARIEGTEVAITAGCNQAFLASIMAVAEPGSSVLLPQPWYFNHEMTCRMLGVEVKGLPTRAAAGFVPDVADAARLIDARTRAIVLVTPNNPTGAIYSPETIAAFFDLARSRGIHLVLDETYRDFRPGASSGPAHALFQRAGWGDNLISLYSFSKSHAIPGHRLGALAGGPQVLEACVKILDCVQICPPRPSQTALLASMEESAPWRAERAAEMTDRAATFRAALADLPEWRIDSIGAYFAYVAHPFPDASSVAVAQALAERFGLLVLPGSFFGPGQEGHLRVAFANVASDGIRRFADRLARARGQLTP